MQIRSLCKQVETAMAFNRRSEVPLSLHALSFGGKVEEFANKLGALAWPMMRHTQPLIEVFPAHKASA